MPTRGQNADACEVCEPLGEILHFLIFFLSNAFEEQIISGCGFKASKEQLQVLVIKMAMRHISRCIEEELLCTWNQYSIETTLCFSVAAENLPTMDFMLGH